MKRLLMTAALVCALSSTALAGDIPAVDKSGNIAPPSPVVTVILTIIGAVV